MSKPHNGSNDDGTDSTKTTGREWEAVARRELYSRFFEQGDEVKTTFIELSNAVDNGEPIDGELFQSARSDLITADQRLSQLSQDFDGPTPGDALADELARLGAQLNGYLHAIAKRRAEGREATPSMQNQAMAAAVDVVHALEEAGVEGGHLHPEADVSIDGARRAPIADGGTVFEWLDDDELEEPIPR